MTKKVRTSLSRRSESVGIIAPLLSVSVLPRLSTGVVVGSWTITTPSMNGCTSHANKYRPGVVNVTGTLPVNACGTSSGMFAAPVGNAQLVTVWTVSVNGFAMMKLIVSPGGTTNSDLVPATFTPVS